MHIVQYTKGGEAHGLVNVLSNHVPFDDFKSMKPDVAEKCRKEKENDARVVKVRYINRRGKTERLDKTYCRWAGDPIQVWHLIPNYVYELPYGLVQEINNKKTIKRSDLQSVDGVPINRNEAPTEKDSVEDLEHMLVPADFF